MRGPTEWLEFGPKAKRILLASVIAFGAYIGLVIFMFGHGLSSFVLAAVIGIFANTTIRNQALFEGDSDG